MKQIYIIVAAILISANVNATTIVAAKNNGQWSNSSDWNLKRVPKNGDSVVIPKGLNFNVDGNEKLDNIVLTIRGVLNFDNGKVRLDKASKVIVDFGGKISGGGNNDRLTIDNTLKYDGTDPDVIGYAVADINSGSGFLITSILPVEFISFSVNETKSGVLLNWSTSKEVSNKYFEIQRSVDGKNWVTAGKVAATVNPASINKYQYIDQSADNTTKYYRIMQVDENGRFVFTEVKSITGTESKVNTKMYKSGSQVIIDFGKVPAAQMSVRILSIDGQVVAQQNFSNAGTRINVPFSNVSTGIYVVHLVLADSISAQKIAL